ncbi:MAG: hypothetical protein ACK53L_26065, partial [Pirellulaceae bacterium]
MRGSTLGGCTGGTEGVPGDTLGGGSGARGSGTLGSGSGAGGRVGALKAGGEIGVMATGGGATAGVGMTLG